MAFFTAISTIIGSETLAQIAGIGVGAGLGYISNDGPPSIVGVGVGVQNYLAYANDDPDHRITVVVSLSPAIDGVLAAASRQAFREDIKRFGVGTARVSGRRDWILTVPLSALPMLMQRPEIAGIRLHEETPPAPAPALSRADLPGWLPALGVGIGAFLLIRRSRKG